MSLRNINGAGRRIGEIATAAGLTIRTLHYYEEIGLLCASSRTEAGHRIYADGDVARLYRITLLRRLGLSLNEVGRALDDPAWDLSGAMTSHLADLEQNIAVEGRLRSRLKRLLATDTIATTDDRTDLLTILEEMTMTDHTVENRISIIVYNNIEGAFDFLKAAFSLGPGELTRDDRGNVVHGELEAGDGVIWLHPESPEFGLASPKALVATTSTTAVMVGDVDAHHRHAAATGASIVYEPVDQPYGYREYSARDLEGHLWSFMKRLT